ncbi:DUF4954 family protein [Marinilabiliaceae bacterium JC017]|nr:DUF4954 family protein [Marinilabiliaceae bacterium JC017]
MSQRNLTPQEIEILQKQGCRATDWQQINVPQQFNPSFLYHVIFEGNIRLEDTYHHNANHLHAPCIVNSRIRNCRIGKNTRITNINLLANYRIGNNTVLENIACIETTGPTTFGNGTRINILNETGGRSIPIFNELSAQLAWLMVSCRHHQQFISATNEIISNYTKTCKSEIGKIGNHVTIRHGGVIKNVTIGDYAILDGITKLEEGTICSDKEDPSIIGTNVIARDFIILEGSAITDGVILDKCFVGQGVQLGKQFSAEHSVFFANSQCFHGEAVSAFVGPYTVSHHKSTLLIGGLYSFFNDGSGTNQSNHMYKLGPMHQGILERGSKTGSFSYLLWPSKIGPFSVVMGKHNNNIDTGDFPFSYITEENGKSILTPAMNLFTVGTRRDTQKWPDRDRRKAATTLDFIRHDLFSPFIMQKVITATEWLDNLYQSTDKKQEFVKINSTYIYRLMLKSSKKYYELGLKIHIGDMLLSFLEELPLSFTHQHIKEKTDSLPNYGAKEWIDVAGAFYPKESIDVLLDNIADCNIRDIPSIQEYLRKHHEHYPIYKAAWFRHILNERYNIELSTIPAEQIIQLIEEWKTSAITLNNMVLKDAQKEFYPTSRIGYGYASHPQIRDHDFEAAHGLYNENYFVKTIKSDIRHIEEKARTTTERINTMTIDR